MSRTCFCGLRMMPLIDPLTGLRNGFWICAACDTVPGGRPPNLG